MALAAAFLLGTCLYDIGAKVPGIAAQQRSGLSNLAGRDADLGHCVVAGGVGFVGVEVMHILWPPNGRTVRREGPAARSSCILMALPSVGRTLPGPKQNGSDC